MSYSQSGEDVTIRFPAKCFSWKWNSFHSDPILHENADKVKALCDWLDGNPHLMAPGELVNGTELLRICLGLGLLLKDASLIQFTEDGGHADETAEFIVQSSWGQTEVEIFGDYLRKVKADLGLPSVSARWGTIGVLDVK
jgi:hypothetical protein